MKRATGLPLLRKKIDAVDDRLLSLLNRRAEIAIAIGKEKGEGRIYAPARESDLLRRVVGRATGCLSAEKVERIFREIISACRSLQGSLKVSYLGPEATFSHLASMGHFGGSARYLPQPSIAQVFEEVEKGGSHIGVVPIENSTEGAVGDTLDRLVETPLVICGEVLQEVRLDLLGKVNRLGEIRKVYTHPQAAAQCRRWLACNLPGVPVVRVSSTGRAARASAKERGAAAVASNLAAGVYGLKVIASGIHDTPGNITRFLVIGRELPEPTGADKTSLLFSVRHRAGALFKALQPFAKRKVNMTKIESRPFKGRAWEYIFFLDLEGHQSERRVSSAIQELRECCEYVKLLGSYPKGESPRDI